MIRSTAPSRLVAALLLALLLAPATSARGQAETDFAVAPQEPDAVAAAEAFAAGERAHAQQRYAEALEHFLRAQSLRAHAMVRFNIAVCLQHLGRFRDAWLEYQALIASDELDEEARSVARAFAATLEISLAVIRIDAPERAEVLIDGAPAGYTPLETRLEPGPHVVAVRRPARESRREITVERGERYDVRLDLPPAPLPDVRLVPMRRVPRDPSWLTGIGGGLAALGIGGVVGFGIHAQSLFDTYDQPDGPTAALQRDGVLFTDLANASIAIASAGALMIAIDLVLLIAGEGSREIPVEETGP